jgi:hypothetical protein
MAKLNKEDIKGFECKHAFFMPSLNGQDDLLVVKEIIHLKDDTHVSNVRLITNFERDIYVTKQAFRNHTDKKEWEKIERLQKFKTTQTKMSETVARVLNLPRDRNMRQYGRNQYLYGTDISLPALIKGMYKRRYDLFTKNTVAVFDIETDVSVSEDIKKQPIWMASISFKDKAVLAVRQDFFKGIINPEDKIREAIEYYLRNMDGQDKDGNPCQRDLIKERGLKFYIHLVEDEVEVIRTCFNYAHEWKPDIMAVWNLDFDVPHVLRRLEEHGANPADIFCDPAVPRKFRQVAYREGARKQVTNNGTNKALPPAEQWHTFNSMSSYYFIDAMALYKRIRMAKGNEESYALDDVLNKHLGMRKLKFKAADHLIENGSTGLAWHEFMQARYKAEYCVYNLFDCISVELLDEKNQDMSMMISILCGISDYADFRSTPRRTCDDMHFFCLDKGHVIAASPDDMKDDNDEHVVGMNGWIVTLPSYMVIENGIRILEDFPDLPTQVRAHVADLDVAAAYPNGEIILNISKETTYRELYRIKGVSEEIQRKTGINLTGGKTNAVEFCMDIHQLPSFRELLEIYNKRNPERAV